MKKIEKILSICPDYPFELLGPKERIVFFDIETTGLSSANAMIYLIGTVTFEAEGWKLTQFFAEGLEDEEALLSGFFALLAEKRKEGRVFLISYNGDGFDIPFIMKCVNRYRLPYDLCNTFSIDLMKKIRPYKKLCGLPDLKLKTVERFLGHYREDRYSGGELIYVYEEYMRLSHIPKGFLDDNDLNHALKQHLLDTLLLHNAEDIADMPLLMNMLSYSHLHDGEWEILSAEMMTDPCTELPVWDIRAVLCAGLPKGIFRETPQYVLSIAEEDPKVLELVVRLTREELKFFYQDYKNYYYLPAEDMAVHKSVGEFVDRKARKQATAKTCYRKKESLFLPQTEPLLAPVFYREYKDKQFFGEADPEKLSGNIELAGSYIKMVLKELYAERNRKGTEEHL